MAKAKKLQTRNAGANSENVRRVRERSKFCTSKMDISSITLKDLDNTHTFYNFLQGGKAFYEKLMVSLLFFPTTLKKSINKAVMWNKLISITKLIS